MSRATTAVLIALVVLLVITSLSMFTVDQRQNAIVHQCVVQYEIGRSQTRDRRIASPTTTCLRTRRQIVTAM